MSTQAGDQPDVFGCPPELRTERLVLRQITAADGEGLFGIFCDDEVTEYYAWDTFTSTEQGHALAARVAAQFARREAIRWGLVLPGVPRVLKRGVFRDVWMFGFTRADWLRGPRH